MKSAKGKGWKIYNGKDSFEIAEKRIRAALENEESENERKK